MERIILKANRPYYEYIKNFILYPFINQHYTHPTISQIISRAIKKIDFGSIDDYYIKLSKNEE